MIQGIKLGSAVRTCAHYTRVIKILQLVLLLRKQYCYNDLKRRFIERSGTKRSGTNFSIRKIKEASTKRSGMYSLYSLYSLSKRSSL
jgi:hypothetical protein